MSVSTLLIILLVVLLFTGGIAGPRYEWGGAHYGGLGLVVAVILVFLLLSNR